MPQDSRHLPWTITPGDGSEACLVCGAWDAFDSFYVRLSVQVADWVNTCEFPVCSARCGKAWAIACERVAAGDEEAEVIVLTVLENAPRAT